MAFDVSVSIIVCTRNRGPRLRQALEAIGRARVPSRWKVELIVVDNGSTDGTSTVARTAKLRTLAGRYLYEPRPGKAHALNAALGETRSDIILTTDDDVIVPEGWIEELVAPLVDGGYDAVTGRIVLGPELRRPWLTRMHRWWLAASDDARLHDGHYELIGANMGFRRSVLTRVPGFDPRLGPGGLGLAEDTLFGWQLIEAGYKIAYACDPTVTHHPDVSRLRRRHWLDDAVKRGRSEAYVRYHWEHADLAHPRLRWLAYWAKLRVRRMLEPPPPLDAEGCPLWEMSYVLRMAECRQLSAERARPRAYERRGLARQGP